LSLEGSRPTRRYESIEVAYLDEQWMPKQLSFSGMPAQIIQHELDHLEGIII
jgi:peptide deformylase